MRNFLFVLIACFLFHQGFAERIIVKNSNELKTAISRAKPGDSIVLTSGNWDNCKLNISCSGNASAPVYIVAEKPGKTVFTGNSQLQLGADHVVVSGFLFTNGYTVNGIPWIFKIGDRLANHCRITNCMIDGFNPPDRMDDHYWISLYGKNNQIDHCSFIDKTNLGVLLAVILDDDRSRQNEHLITDNYFGMRRPLGSNAGEIIRVGVSQHCTFYSNTRIFNNVFDNCDGEGEVISIKSCGNQMKGNIFQNCQGALVLRHGNDNLVEGNAFLGNGKEGTGGVRIINEGNWVLNNFFSHCAGTDFRTPLTIMNGVPNSPPNRYLPVRDAVIMNNTFYDCSAFHVGEGADTERSEPPKNVFFLNNLFVNEKNRDLKFSFSNTDSVFYINNQLSGKLSVKEPGFFTARPAISKIGSLEFPLSAQSNTVSPLPDFITRKLSGRKEQLSGKIGAGTMAYFSQLIRESKNKGIFWKRDIEMSRISPVISCSDASALYAALEKGFDVLRIKLTGNSYQFDRPIKLGGKLWMTGNGKTQLFSSASTISSVFVLGAFSEIKMEGLKIDGSGLKAVNFIQADTGGRAMHFAIRLLNASFRGFSGQSFFEAPLHSYADNIEMTGVEFRQNKCVLLNMGAEQENKGYYSTETMRITNCRFMDHEGALLILYRGGNDESTMGPRIDITGNRFINCKAIKPLIQLSGVQYSMISNNQFSQANPDGDVITYVDWVRAKHYLRNNSYTGSGRINTNKFLLP